MSMATGSSLYLWELRRLDPRIEEILAVSPHATLYEMDLHTQLWLKKDVEGSLFIVKRNAPERFKFIITNTINQEYFVEDILGISEYNEKAPFLMYRNKDGMVRAIEFTNPQASMDICKLLQRILSAYMRIALNPKLPPSESEAEELASDPSSGFEVDSDFEIESDFLDYLILELERSAETTSEPEPIPLLSPVTPALTSAPLENYLVKPSDFGYRAPSLFVPISNSSSSSAIHFDPRTVANSVMTSSQFGTRSITPYLPAIRPHSAILNSSDAPTISREIIRQNLASLVSDDSFVDMIFQEIIKRHLTTGQF